MIGVLGPAAQSERLLELRPLRLPVSPPPSPYGQDEVRILPPPTSTPTKRLNKYETFKLHLRALGWTVYFGAKGFFKGPQPANPQGMSKLGQTLHKILPGDTVAGLFSKLVRTPEEIAIPHGPVSFPIDPSQYMANLVFVGGKNPETSFPVAAGFDGDADVNNNRRHYRHGSMTGEQIPTTYVHTTMKGRFAVIQYKLYFVDNKFSNYHDHDWEGYQVYLEQRNGRWEPAYLYTSWHHTGEMLPWDQLEIAPNGRPYVYVERGAHGSLPLRKGQQPKADKGWTLYADGTAVQRGTSRVEKPGIRYLSPDPNVVGAEPPEQTANGSILEEKYWYNFRVFGFFPYEKSDWSWGPAKSGKWDNPVHPSRFGYALDDVQPQPALLSLSPLG